MQTQKHKATLQGITKRFSTKQVTTANVRGMNQTKRTERMNKVNDEEGERQSPNKKNYLQNASDKIIRIHKSYLSGALRDILNLSRRLETKTNSRTRQPNK